jgi:hypothetical protein
LPDEERFVLVKAAFAGLTREIGLSHGLSGEGLEAMVADTVSGRLGQVLRNKKA